MSAILEFTLPATELALGEALVGNPGVSLELERIVPTGQGVVPFVWVTDGDYDAFAESVRAGPEVEAFVELDRVADGRLYRLNLGGTSTELFRGMTDTDAAILEASGGDVWRFRVRFPDRERLSQFDAFCAEHGIPIHVQRVSTLRGRAESEGQFGLSPKERAGLVLALERGYFATPRQVDLTGLAIEFDISRQALSDRIRRANEKVLQATLSTERDDEATDGQRQV